MSKRKLEIRIEKQVSKLMAANVDVPRYVVLCQLFDEYVAKAKKNTDAARMCLDISYTKRKR